MINRKTFVITLNCKSAELAAILLHRVLRELHLRATPAAYVLGLQIKRVSRTIKQFAQAQYKGAKSCCSFIVVSGLFANNSILLLLSHEREQQQQDISFANSRTNCFSELANNFATFSANEENHFDKRLQLDPI